MFLNNTVYSQQPALLIQRFFTNPSGTDAPNEFVELLATRSINFANEPFTIVFTDGSLAGSNGWASGGTGSYAFQISTGTMNAGDLGYIGGTGLSNYIQGGASCLILRQINTATSVGDVLGSASPAALGNGGTSADGIAVFNMSASSINSTSTPIDAIFFGSAIGSAASKYMMPVNDHYSGGVFGNSGNTFLAPDPSSGDYIFVERGTFNTQNFSWSIPRTWNSTTTKPTCSNPSSITLENQTNILTAYFDTANTTNFLQLPNISGVMNDPTDPAATKGIIIEIKENGNLLPATDFSLSVNSSNQSVVQNAGIISMNNNGSAIIKIVPAGIGYTTLSVVISSITGNQKTLQINYAASAASLTPSNTCWHTSMSDASDGIPLDDTYFLSGDDELNIINLFSRKESGLPLLSYNYASALALPDGVAEEVDMEAAAKSPFTNNKIYWIGSMSNGKSPNFNNKPNRNRLFATTVTGSSQTVSFSFNGYYGNLRNQLIAWGDANGYNFSASAAAGKDSKSIDGFAVEGMVFGPDKTTLYIAFRAPLVPTASRTKAVIAPITNFETWFNNGNMTGNPIIGAPIELDMGGRGCRDIIQLSNGVYVIVAGNPEGSPITSALFMWSGNRIDEPVLMNNGLNGILNMEGVMEVRENGQLSGNQLQVISDNGSDVFYNDAIEAKDLSENNFKKFRSDIVNYTCDWKYIFNGNGNWSSSENWINQIVPPAILPAPQQITINPSTNGTCYLNIPQQIISSGANITISPGARFTIPQNLIVQ